MRRLGILVSVLALASVAGATKVTISTGEFGVTCTSTGQLCDPPETLLVGDPAQDTTVRKIVYTASAAHCSSGRILISVDGKQVGRMRFVNRNESTTLRKRIRVLAGLHTFAFRFEGRVGGCNAGAVSGWGGTITLFARR